MMKARFWGKRDSAVGGAVLNAAKLIVFLTGCIVLLPAFALAQKTIIIDESLSANADKMNVKMGWQVGEVWKFRFGDYAVVSPKLTVTTGTSKTNIWGSRTETKSKRKFLYLLKGPTPDTARVNAAQNIDVKTSQSIEILSHISLGSDEVLAETDNFVAFIKINEDDADTWTLIMNVVRRTGGEQENPKSFLTNGVRKILLIPVTSNKDGDARGTPALGYELSENGQALGAVQYNGGGLFAWNKTIIYIDRNLEPKMKLLLAAAMTAVLQVKVRPPKF
ncbi:MAG: hypothetical protein ABSG73_11620 [Candidatus Aminicenantales bacterium]